MSSVLEGAGLSITWNDDWVTIRGSNRQVHVSSGRVAEHEVDGASTNLGDLWLQGGMVWGVATSLRVDAQANVQLSFGTLMALGELEDVLEGEYETLLSDHSFWLKANRGSIPVTQVTGYGEWLLYDGTSARIRFRPFENRDSLIEVGYHNYTRGVIFAHAEQATHEEEGSGASDRPGVMVLETPAGRRVFLWARDSVLGKVELCADILDPGDGTGGPETVVLGRWHAGLVSSGKAPTMEGPDGR